MKKSKKIKDTSPSDIDIADMIQSLKDESNLLDFYERPSSEHRD